MAAYNKTSLLSRKDSLAECVRANPFRCNFHYTYSVSTFSPVSGGGDGQYVQSYFCSIVI